MEGNARTWFTRRAVGALRLAEREEISRGIAAGRSLRFIAQGLGRNGGCSAYRPVGLIGTPGSGRWPEALSPGAPCGVAMARRAEARAGVVAGAPAHSARLRNQRLRCGVCLDELEYARSRADNLDQLGAAVKAISVRKPRSAACLCRVSRLVALVISMTANPRQTLPTERLRARAVLPARQ